MSNEFFALDSEGGDPLWYLQVLMTIKASGDKTGGALGLLDFKTPAGQTPLHVHHKEDEGWYLLEGRISCTCGDETVTAGPGSFLWLPRDVPHRLRFETECHLLQIAIPAGLFTSRSIHFGSSTTACTCSTTPSTCSSRRKPSRCRIQAPASPLRWPVRATTATLTTSPTGGSAWSSATSRRG